MNRLCLLLCKRYIVRKLFNKGYKKSSINKIMVALDLNKIGIPEFENVPPPPPPIKTHLNKKIKLWQKI